MNKDFTHDNLADLVNLSPQFQGRKGKLWYGVGDVIYDEYVVRLVDMRVAPNPDFLLLEFGELEARECLRRQPHLQGPSTIQIWTRGLVICTVQSFGMLLDLRCKTRPPDHNPTPFYHLWVE